MPKTLSKQIFLLWRAVKKIKINIYVCFFCFFAAGIYLQRSLKFSGTLQGCVSDRVRAGFFFFLSSSFFFFSAELMRGFS